MTGALILLEWSGGGAAGAAPYIHVEPPLDGIVLSTPSDALVAAAVANALVYNATTLGTPGSNSTAGVLSDAVAGAVTPTHSAGGTVLS